MQNSNTTIVCRDLLDDGVPRPPRCLATLPHNIEELINKFNAQGQQVELLKNANKNASSKQIAL